jgi:hypothetical protein
MPRPDIDADDDSQPVMVPRSDKALVPTSPDRLRRLRDHVASMMVRMRGDETASPPRPEPAGFAARVARTACSLCKGWCCRNGGDDAFLDEQTLARVCSAKPEMDAAAVTQLYVERVPALGYEGSCVFHGKQGCTLDRSLRSDVCNAYFCGGLYAYLKGGDRGSPAVVIAGEGDRMRTSPVLFPR